MCLAIFVTYIFFNKDIFFRNILRSLSNKNFSEKKNSNNFSTLIFQNFKSSF